MSRRQRRAKDSSSHPSQTSIHTADDIPLVRPDVGRSKAPKGKTLLEIAAQRQAQLNPGQRVDTDALDPENVVQFKIGEDGQLTRDSDASSSESQTVDAAMETPWLDAILLAMSLSAIHFTLETLTVHQYAQELHFPPIIRRTLFVAFPTLTLMIALFHGLLLPISAQKVPGPVRLWILALRQLAYLVVANVAGCYLIQLTNDKGYYAVMKNAPSIGTIWVWTVLELGLLGALAGVIGPGLYAWKNGYGIF
ncbi:hypothetical protein A1O1_08881 [Capronia coronata CBS 617.96]|uniref:DUF7719 domain-containing protein n=1 Tax=Capronia coronata CBS 617.96 TaxID=1182541 RepID=W9XNE9_9EURO|nr:uncharacterized protein A1O1_08881 [Capronia coronata CBS 617.96]EXJ78481.1 hypothetical protein A1O1_08881 [Capronia coronata CBS 617.96]